MQESLLLLIDRLRASGVHRSQANLNGQIVIRVDLSPKLANKSIAYLTVCFFKSKFALGRASRCYPENQFNETID